MAFLNWESSYSVGVPRLDSQHQQLVQLLNELHSAMMAGAANAALSGILFRLISYTKTHFAEEEAHMRAIRFPGLAEHKNQHDRLTAEVGKLAADLQAGKVALSMNVMNFMKNWLKNHILGADQEYKLHQSGVLRSSGQRLVVA